MKTSLCSLGFICILLSGCATVDTYRAMGYSVQEAHQLVERDTRRHVEFIGGMSKNIARIAEAQGDNEGARVLRYVGDTADAYSSAYAQ